MFTASALRNMDPALEEAAEVSGASAVRILFTVTFPLIAPAIISGMLLSFIVMLGIYGIPAVLGAPGDIPVLTTYIFKLTNWSPPLYSTAASVAIILMIVTGFLVYLQQQVISGRSYITVAGKAFRPGVMKLGPWRYFTLGARGRLSGRRGGAADAGADRRGLPQVPVHPQRRKPVRHEAVFADPLRAAVRQSAGDALDLEHHGGRAGHRAVRRRARLRDRLHGQPHAGRRAAGASTSSRRCRSRSRASSSASPICGPGSACPAGSTARSGSSRSPSSRASCPTPSRRCRRRCCRSTRSWRKRPGSAARACSAPSAPSCCRSRAPASSPAMTLLFILAIRELGSSLFLYTSEHHGDGGAAARLLRGRQCRHHVGLQPGADRCCSRVLIGIAHFLSRGGADSSGSAARVRNTKTQKGETLMTRLRITRRQFTAGAAAGVAAAAFGITPAAAQNFGGHDLIDAAKKEGKIVYYTADFTEPEQEIIKAFNKRFPFVKVEMVRAPGGQLITRIKTEAAAGKLLADVGQSFRSRPDARHRRPVPGLRAAERQGLSRRRAGRAAALAEDHARLVDRLQHRAREESAEDLDGPVQAANTARRRSVRWSRRPAARPGPASCSSGRCSATTTGRSRPRRSRCCIPSGAPTSDAHGARRDLDRRAALQHRLHQEARRRAGRDHLPVGRRAAQLLRGRRHQDRRQSERRQAVPQLEHVRRGPGVPHQGARLSHGAEESAVQSARLRPEGDQAVVAELRAVRQAARRAGSTSGTRPTATGSNRPLSLPRLRERAGTRMRGIRWEGRT